MLQDQMTVSAYITVVLLILVAQIFRSSICLAPYCHPVQKHVKAGS
uniref:Uncharacterized protein n=1 Tax=Arundo donax TaxID=35708 RepID=A0A0A9AL75_ARUDO